MKGGEVVSILLVLLFPSGKLSLECFFCRHTLRNKEVADKLDQHPECMSYEMFSVMNGTKRTCSSREPYCVSTVINLNGYFLEVSRDCDEVCKPMCTETGYGLGYTECTRCCQTDLCNNYDGRNYFLPNDSFKMSQIILLHFHFLVYSLWNL